MHTITTTHISPVTIAAAWRDDDDNIALVDGITVNDWLTRYWRGQIRAVLPQPHDEKPAAALSRLADALASEDITDAVGIVMDYREFTDRPTNDGTITRMMLDTLLDWSKWCGDPRIDDARAQDWLRALVT